MGFLFLCWAIWVRPGRRSHFIGFLRFVGVNVAVWGLFSEGFAEHCLSVDDAHRSMPLVLFTV